MFENFLSQLNEFVGWKKIESRMDVRLPVSSTRFHKYTETPEQIFQRKDLVNQKPDTLPVYDTKALHEKYAPQEEAASLIAKEGGAKPDSARYYEKYISALLQKDVRLWEMHCSHIPGDSGENIQFSLEFVKEKSAIVSKI